jgi:hypothetical protein
MKQPRKRWDLVGALVGIALGTADTAAFLLFDADLTLSGRDVTLVVLLLFVLSYGVLGFAVGRLAMARERARADAATSCARSRPRSARCSRTKSSPRSAGSPPASPTRCAIRSA